MATVTKGRTFTSGEVVTPAKLNDIVDNATVTNIVTADVSASAAIAFSKLAALDSANILVGNGSNVATKVAVTGDVTISNAGVTAIGSAKVLPAMLSQPFTLATSQATTSGTEKEFTSIPSWAKRITVIFGGVSLSLSEHILIQLGASTYTTTGYGSASNFLNGGTNSGIVTSTSGFIVYAGANASTITGSVRINLLTGNTWVADGVGVYQNGAQMFTAGSVALSGALDRIKIKSESANTFDAGTINISYEG